ncbi:MAG TPA: hypothetical protein VEM39_10245 [Myxococcaceae bacterium]|nr:hypothetical protein [Myxococcaceae bacterium]
MWGLLKFLIWTGFAIWLGIFIATQPVAGHTPMQHLERVWKQHGFSAQVNNLKGRAQGAVEDAKDSLSTVWDKKPRERHTAQDRQAVNKLVAKRGEDK